MVFSFGQQFQAPFYGAQTGAQRQLVPSDRQLTVFGPLPFLEKGGMLSFCISSVNIPNTFYIYTIHCK